MHALNPKATGKPLYLEQHQSIDRQMILSLFTGAGEAQHHVCR